MKKLIIFIKIQVIIALLLSVTDIAYATDNENKTTFPYVVSADRIHINSWHVSINGKCLQGHPEQRIDKQRTVIEKCILNQDEEISCFSDTDVTIENLENFNVGCINTININQQVMNAKSVLYSKNGSINIECENMNYGGIIYAPKGTIHICGKNVTLNAVLIAETVCIEAENVTINKNEEMAAFLGNKSDVYVERKDIYTYKYDVFGNTTSISVGNRNLVRYSYQDSFSTCLEKEEYANGTYYDYLKEVYEDSDNQSEDAMNAYVEENSIFSLDRCQKNVEAEQKEISYFYDEQNQLIRVNDRKLDRTFLYSYDAHGNIIKKQEYKYSLNIPFNMIREDIYSYNSDWMDCLTDYNGQKIQSDAIGNPLTYKGWKLNWECGNQLKSADNLKHNLAFEYDYFGLRTKKADNGTETVFKYVDRNIVEQDNGKYKLVFKYDKAYNVIGFHMNGVDYFYKKNLQNDVLKIVDALGNIVVEYAYDPWGKVMSVNGILADTVGQVNPIRYRSYYYDTEWNMYYLLSRYYDPDTCRFLSVDNFWYLSCDNNLFQYCNNNPVKYVDENGHLAWEGGRPSINSAQDQKDYDVLVKKAQKTLQIIGFTKITKGQTIDYLAATHEFSIRSLKKRAHFLSQCAIESEWGYYTTEYGNDNYFKNKWYGKKYRGGGYIQVTGKDNYAALADYMDDRSIYALGADYVGQYYAWRAAGWWWMENGINKMIDKGTSVNSISLKVTHAPNIDRLNLTSKGKERRAVYKKIKKLL